MILRGCIAVLEADAQKVRKQVFNVGDTNENYQKKMLAEELQKLIPTMKVKYVKRTKTPETTGWHLRRSIISLDSKLQRQFPMA